MQHKRGFTLIELIIVLAILGIFLSGVYFIFINASNMNRSQNLVVQSQETLRIASLRIEQDIRKSSQSITIQQTGSSHCYEIIEEGSNKIEYCLNGHVLMRNGSIVIDGLSNFEIIQGGDDTDNTNNQIIDIILESIFNGKGSVHEQRIYLRNR